jgi:long-chain acyl-CoA synthetase
MKNSDHHSFIDSLSTIDAGDAARRLGEALSAAADASEEQRRSLDCAVARLLADAHHGRLLVEHLPLATILELARRTADRLGDEHPAPPGDNRDAAWDLLELARDVGLRRRIAADGVTDDWSDCILRLVDGSDFTFARLFAQRVACSGARPLFLVPGADGTRTVTWNQVAGRVDLIARGLLALTASTGDRPVAILSENRLEMAILDLACLASGIPNVMIPATATEADVDYILRHAGVGTVVVSTADQLAKVMGRRDQNVDLHHVVALDPAAHGRDVLPWDRLLERSSEVPAAALARRRDGLRVDDLATVMYTSGTTGLPKGIQFSHRNIVFKRFARALALPEIGESDRFLAYLPLFHTFGRFLEMTGCVFWGATYCFAESSAIDSLVRHMRELAPTVFISIPLKWMQLHDLIRQEVNLETASDGEIRDVVRRVTGGSLRWGLSAAGYLDPEVFQFFQRYGVELMSGFGMTEATGGITMTPPGRYTPDSLGRALPGIEIRLADDGELLVRGPYVMIGYLDPPDGAPSFDDDGWLHTGDLMEMDDEGFIRIVDRKKEIYKNAQGQTIAPQKIENLFRDFESVARVFLVGDHRPYNTALIYPNFDFAELDLRALTAPELKDHFRSLVVSANTFLAPFERIVDFAVIDRDFDLGREEITAKGTYRRKTIERGFADTISKLYRRTTLRVGGAEVTIPNWLFQALGITTQDVAVAGDRLRLASFDSELVVARTAPGETRIGDVVYGHADRSVDLGYVLSTPQLWLGNHQLVELAPLTPAQRSRRRRSHRAVEWLHRAHTLEASPEDRSATAADLARGTSDVIGLHRAALLLWSGDRKDALAAVRLIELLLTADDSELAEASRAVLRRTALAASPDVIRRGFQVLALAEQESAYATMIETFLDASSDLLNAETTAVLVERLLTPEQLEAFVVATHRRSSVESELATTASLLRFLTDYGVAHPISFRRLRAFLTRLARTAPVDAVRELAARERDRITQGFRIWLGATSQIAVDPETGREYRWEDVVAFADDVEVESRQRLLAALRSNQVLLEAIFLFFRGSTVRLSDILPGGVWIRRLGADHGKSVYRVAVKTRLREQYDLAINLNHTLNEDEVAEEIDWLVICGEERGRGKLVEDFGGYWPAHGLWTEEFIPGETLDRAIAKIARRPQNDERLTGVWPFAAWSAIVAFVGLWERTGRRYVIADPGPSNVIIPMHDYHTGARLVSISNRRPFPGLHEMLTTLYRSLVAAMQAEHPRLAGLVGWDAAFSALLEVVGETTGLELLDEMARGGGLEPAVAAALPSFLESVSRRGFLPRRLFFAGKRYRRWAEINPEATTVAKAQTLQEIYDTYGLAKLRESYPESRVRFFAETVFRGAPQPLLDGLDTILHQLRSGALPPDELSFAVADLRAHLDVDHEWDYYLARLSYPYLRPEDEVEYVDAATGGGQQSEMVVTLEDGDGFPYRIRHALNPKEVGRLHRLFLAARLDVRFRPEHRFLVAVSDRSHLMGGLFYEIRPEAHTAHMDKVVVAEHSSGKGIGGALINELCNRLRSAGVRSLTTGFFRPEFFYRHGFSVERRYAGLVRPLTPDQEGVS